MINKHLVSFCKNGKGEWKKLYKSQVLHEEKETGLIEYDFNQFLNIFPNRV